MCGDARDPRGALESGLGGAIFSAQSRLALSNTSVNTSSASAGGALYASSSAVELTAVRFGANSALSGGGAAFLGGDSRVSATASAFDGNVAAFGAAFMVVDSGSLSLAASSASNNHASASGGAFHLGAATSFNASGANSVVLNHAVLSGGVAFVTSPRAQPTFAASSVVGSTAGNWGPVAASDGYTLALAVPRTVRPGYPLPATITIVDALGQNVNRLAQSTIVVSCPAQPEILTSPFVNVYARSESRVAGLSLRGLVGRNYTLVFTVTAPDFGLFAPVAAAVTVTAAPCGYFEVRRDGGKKIRKPLCGVLRSSRAPLHRASRRFSTTSRTCATAQPEATAVQTGSARAQTSSIHSRPARRSRAAPKRRARSAPQSGRCARTACWSRTSATGTAGVRPVCSLSSACFGELKRAPARASTHPR